MLYAHIWWHDTRDGTRGEFHDSFPSLSVDEETGEPNPFWWEEGNGSCLCNREIALRDRDAHDVECGDRSVILIEKMTAHTSKGDPVPGWIYSETKTAA